VGDSGNEILCIHFALSTYRYNFARNDGRCGNCNTGQWGGARNAPQFSPFATPAASGFRSNAEFAAHVGDGVLLRGINVKKVTNPSTGIYCVEPSVTLDAYAIYPQVTVDWDRSSGSALLAFVKSQRDDCPKSAVEVTTYDFNSGTIELSNGVGFYLYVN
jgi:hypothetical protein